MSIIKKAAVALLLTLALLAPSIAGATVTVETTRNDYTGTGTTGPFPYQFRIFAASDLMVIQGNIDAPPLTLNVDYTVSGVGAISGGNVTLTTALPTGTKLTILRNMSYLQSQNWQSNYALTAKSLNDMADKIEMQAQQLHEMIRRAPLLRRSMPVAAHDILLPDPSARKLLGWDIAGRHLVNYDTTTVNVPEDGTTRVCTEAEFVGAFTDSGTSIMVVCPFTLTAARTVPKPLYIQPSCLITTAGFALAENSQHLSLGDYQQYSGGNVDLSDAILPYVSPQWFGSVGDGNKNFMTSAVSTTHPEAAKINTVFAFPKTSITQDSAGIQEAIKAAGSKLILIPNTGNRYWISPLWARDNTHIKLAPGVELKADEATMNYAGTIKTHCMLRIHNVDNVSLEATGASFVMTKPDGEFVTPSDSEQNHCVFVAGSSNVLINHGRYYGSGGDGILIGEFPITYADVSSITGNTHPTAMRHSMNVTVLDPDCDNNKRQGMSITDGVNIVSRGGVFRNTYGTAPTCGIDIEPNSGSIMRGVRIEDAKTENNYGGGVAWAPHYFKDQITELWLDEYGVEQADGTGTSYGVTHDITILNPYSIYDRSRGVGSGQRSSDYMNATIRVINPTIVNSRNASIIVANNTYAKVIIEHPTIINPNSKMKTVDPWDSNPWGSTDYQGNSGIYLYSELNPDPLLAPYCTRYSNVSITDAEIIDNRPVSFTITTATTEPSPGDVLVGLTSGAAGVVDTVTAWGAAGVIALERVNGTFLAAESVVFASTGAACCTIDAVTDERRMWYGISTSFSADTMGVDNVILRNIRINGAKSISGGGAALDLTMGTPAGNYWDEFDVGIFPPITPWLGTSGTSVALLEGQSGWTQSTRLKSGGNTAYTLPAAIPGLEYGFINEQDAYRLTVSRAGTDVIKGLNGGVGATSLASGQATGLTGYGSAVRLKCFAPGVWSIVSIDGPWYDSLGWASGGMGTATHDYGAAAVDWTLTDNEAARSYITVTNASGAVNAILQGAIPGKTYTVYNNSGQTLTFKVTGQTGIAIANTTKQLCYVSATDVVGAQAALTNPVTGVNAPTAGYLVKWGATGNALVDGPKLGTLTDAMWCKFTTANGLQCTEAAPVILAAASVGDVNTGTSTTVAVTPDALAGSNLGTKTLQLLVQDNATALVVGNASAAFDVPVEMNGMVLVSVGAQVGTYSSNGTPTFKIEKFHLSAAGTRDAAVQMCSTNITIDINEFDSKDATTAAVISAVAGAATVATGDRIIGSCVTDDGTGTLGGTVRMGFRLP